MWSTKPRLSVGVGELVTFCSPVGSGWYSLVLDENGARDDDGTYE
jgi:hypothetical protein